MKKLIFILALLTILLFAVATPGNSAYAQETCHDATGAEIACPSSSDPTGGGSNDDSNSGSGGNQPGGGNPNPPSSVVTPTFTPEPTNTPLPEQAVPTQDPTKVFESSPTPTNHPRDIFTSGNITPSASDDSWDGVCPLRDNICLDQLVAACDADGGLYEETDYEDIDATAVHCSIGDTKPAPSIPLGPLGLTALVIILAAVAIPAFIKMKQRGYPSSSSGSTGLQTREHILLNKDDTDASGTDGTGSGRDVIVSRDDKDKE